MLLILLALAMAGLLLLGIIAALAPAARPLGARAGAGCCLVGAGLAIAGLAVGVTPVILVLPVGLPGAGLTLAWDGLSGWFLLPVFLAGAAALIAALDTPGNLSLLPAFVGAMALAVLAGDGFSLLLGFELMSLLSWGVILAHGDDAASRDAAPRMMGMAAVAGFCLLAALGLLAARPAAGVVDLGFAAIRAAPPEGWRGSAVLLLVAIGIGSKAGLAPLHVWLPPAHAAAPAPASALMSGAMTKVALYAIVRVLFDLAGAAPPLWWGLVLAGLGVASAVLGALRATQEPELKTILACSTIENVGLVTVGLGVALAARAADVTPLASLALGAALLHVLAHGLFKPLLFLVAGAVQHGAGTRLLSRLGGLVWRMPVTTWCAIVGAAALAGVPPGPGFASEWLLFQAVLAAPRTGGLAVQTAFATVVAAMALAAALAAVAAVRLIGVAFLGRPRSPRAAAAEECGPATRTALVGLAGLALLVGVFPGAALRLAEPALHQLLAASLADRAGALAVSAQVDATGYAAPALLLLLLAMGGTVLLVVSRTAPGGARRAPAWNCGFAAAPAWLPFGDPLTQFSGTSFSGILARTLGGSLLRTREQVVPVLPGETGAATALITAADPSERFIFAPGMRLRLRLSALADRVQFLPVRRLLAVMFTLLVLLLALVAALESG